MIRRRFAVLDSRIRAGLSEEERMSCFKYVSIVVAQCAWMGMAYATEPCPTPTFQPCNAVTTRTLVQVDHADARAGYTTGSFSVAGQYGSGAPNIEETGNRFLRDYAIRSTQYIESAAEAGTDDGTMLARARSEADLARGTMRAYIEGYDAVAFPNSLLEVSQARVDIWLREFITFHLPAHYGGGTVRVSMFVDGAIEDERPRGTFAPTEVVAQMNLGAGSGNSQTKRWSAAGTIADVITLEYDLIATSAAPIDQLMGIEAFLRLSSGDGNGGYLIDFFNTARLSMAVPQGVTWDSGSGVFLSAVPEGSAAAYLLAGLGVLGVAVRRSARCSVSCRRPR